MMTRRAERTGGRGHAIVEGALMFPLLFFLFVGVFDMGFYAYSLISTANAARAAALYTSGSPLTADNRDGACCFALRELAGMGNVTAPAYATRTCACATIDAVTDASPVGVRAERLDADSTPRSADGNLSSRVTVRYRTIRMIPIPGMLAGQQTITRAVEVRVRGF